MADGDFKAQVDLIRSHSDIVEVIGRYIQLQRKGPSFKALCPFHKEKTPSFTVDATKQYFHCFGCNAGGDVFNFVMQYENVGFVDAAHILADRAGLTFNPGAGGGGGTVDRSEKTRLFEVHEQLAALYARTLEQHESAAAARVYLAERDLQAACSDFQIGLAPPQPGALEKWAAQKQISMDLLEKAGVLLPSDRGGAPYDRFRGRLMFPIRDEQGRVVAFSGRILDQSSAAKYVNSPETMLFKKGRVLYGLDRARKPMVEQRRALLCEGQIDVIRCHLSGFPFAVAPQGTALTEDHARLLKRYADEIVLVFDADTAGQNAALRGAEVLLRESLTVRVACLPEGEDPDSLLRTRGKDVFGSFIAEAMSLVQYHAHVHRLRGDLESEAGRLRTIRGLLELILNAPGAVQRESFLVEAAELHGMSVAALREDMQKMIRPTVRRTEEEGPDRLTPKRSARIHPPEEQALVELMIAHPEVLDLVSHYVPPKAIADGTCRTLIRMLLEQPEPDHTELMRDLADKDEACRQLAAKLLMTARRITSEETSCIEAVQDIILKLRIRLIDREIQDHMSQLLTATSDQKRVLNNEVAQLMILKKRMQGGWDKALPILDLDH